MRAAVNSVVSSSSPTGCTEQMQAASAEALKFETLSRWASTTNAALEFSSDLDAGPVRPSPTYASPAGAQPTSSSASARGENRAALFEPRLADDGALHPTMSSSQRAFSVPAPPHDDSGGAEQAGSGDEAAAKSASDTGHRSPEPLWGGSSRLASPAHRSQSQQSSPPPPSWFGADPTMQGNRLAATMDMLRQENERLAIEEASRQLYGSLPTASQYLETSTAVQKRQPAPAEYVAREQATQQTSQQIRALDHSEQQELERLRQRTHELEMNVQSSYIQTGTVHAELDKQRRATAAAEERARALQTKLEKERRAVQRLTSRPIPTASAPAAVASTRSIAIAPTRSSPVPDDVMVAGGDGSPFAAAREELNALQNTTARFSDSKNELAKSAARIAELEETIRDRDAELLRKDQLLREKEELLRRHEELLRDRDRRLAKLASGMRELTHEAEPQ